MLHSARFKESPTFVCRIIMLQPTSPVSVHLAIFYMNFSHSHPFIGIICPSLTPTNMFALTTMADHTGTESNKRRKIISPRHIVNIGHLPEEALAAVATFFPKASQTLFVVAMTSPRRKSPRTLLSLVETNHTILSLNHRQVGCCHDKEQRCDNYSNKEDKGIWSTLDFADIDATLASKLSDDDLRRVLVSIDAVNRLVSLKLTGCVNITGSGLMPLMSSTVLVQIDLSILRGNTSVQSSEPQLDEQLVIPILNSIIDAEGNSLSHVQLPKKFRSTPSPIVDSFIERYDEFLEQRGDICSHCDFDEPWGNMDGGGSPWVFDSHPFYGLQNYTCYECTSHVCVDICLQFCTNCEKSYCTDCMSFTVCRYCPIQLCKSCGELTTCERCSYHACDSCSSMGECHQESCWLPGIAPFAGKRGMGL